MTPPSTGHLERNRWTMAIVIVVAVAAAFSNSFSGPFIFDDIGCILENPSIRHLWPIGPVLSPASEGGRTVAGRPLVNLSLAVNYAISGTNAWSYHVFNLLVHMAAAVTLWAIARRTLRIPVVLANVRDSADGLATAGALLWATHPLTTSAVSYVIQRAESMMALSYLLTLYCVIRVSESARAGIWQLGAVAACATGMACKEVMATAPIVVLLYDRTFLAGSFVQALRSRRWMYTGLFATWLIPVALLGGRGDSAGFGGPIGVWGYALTQLRFIPLYLRLCVWPSPLVFDYGTPLIGSVREVWVGVVLLIALILATAVAMRVRPMLGFLMACIFIILAPSSSIFPVSTQTGAEHRMYLPRAAVVAIVVLAGYRYVATAFGRSSRYAGAVMIAAVAIALGITTYKRNNDYRSWKAIWADTIAKVPENPRAYHNLALHYFRAGQYAEAVEQSRVAVGLRPDFPDGYLHLANAEAALGRHEEAINDFGRAIQLVPKSAAAYFNRGNSYFALSRLDKAIEDYDAAI